MQDAYFAFMGFMEQGGGVLPFIFGLTIVMWTLIVERLWYFWFEHRATVANFMRQWDSRAEHRSWTAHQIRDGLISQASNAISGTLPLIQTCVSLAPLFGLLGTVTGMVQVFDAMASQGGNARSMAAGVSAATIPTMAGMTVSLSGLFAATYLKGKVEREIEAFQDHLTTED